MKNESIILEGKDLQEITQEGLKQLDKREDQVEIEILEKGKTIAGISIRKCKIKIRVLESTLEAAKEEFSSSVISPDIEIEEQIVLERFKIQYEEDGVYLSIHPVGSVGASLQDVLDRVKKKEITEVDYNKVEDAVKVSEKTAIKIAPKQEEKLIDSTIEVEISKDKMHGYLTIQASDGGKDYTAEEVIKYVSEQIRFGLKEDLIKEYVEKKRYGIKELVAEGLKEIDGKDGYIDYKFKNEKETAPYISEDGTVDFRKLDLIKNVIKDDLLAELYLPEEGRDGTNVLGEKTSHKPGLEKSFNYGINVKLSDDGRNLISDIDGQICLENGKVIVYELYTVSNDIDNSTGDIEFNGNIKINGNVLTGFTVIAKGNIEIDGVVEGATIKCGGDLFIQRGIQGYNVASVETNGNLITKYIENAKVNCGKDIEAEAIMHSETICGGNINIGGKKGLLVGGICKAGEKITAKIIGSHMATATVLEVGLDPSVRENQENLKTMKKDIKTDIDKFNQMINHLTRLGKQEALAPDKQNMLEKSFLAKEQLEKNIIALDGEIENIDEKIKNSSSGSINVKESIFSGVRIAIGNSSILVHEKKDYCTISRSEGEIRISPLA